MDDPALAELISILRILSAGGFEEDPWAMVRERSAARYAASRNTCI